MLLFQLFEYLGFNLNKFDESNPIVYVFVGILFLDCLCFLGVLNVSFYFLSIYVIDNKLEYISKYIIKDPIKKNFCFFFYNPLKGLCLCSFFQYFIIIDFYFLNKLICIKLF